MTPLSQHIAFTFFMSVFTSTISESQKNKELQEKSCHNSPHGVTCWLIPCPEGSKAAADGPV